MGYFVLLPMDVDHRRSGGIQKVSRVKTERKVSRGRYRRAQKSPWDLEIGKPKLHGYNLRLHHDARVSFIHSDAVRYSRQLEFAHLHRMELMCRSAGCVNADGLDASIRRFRRRGASGNRSATTGFGRAEPVLVYFDLQKYSTFNSRKDCIIAIRNMVTLQYVWSRRLPAHGKRIGLTGVS
jgi:hypothetical protein